MSRLVVLLVILLFSSSLVGQPIYEMSNATVDDCEGILLDSNNGELNDQYDHNENYTFSICIPEATAITLTFSSFCTELGFDTLRIFDGADTLSPLLGGPFSGEITLGSFTASSGCLTLHFGTDPSVSCTGWVATWQTEYDLPPPPDILPLPNLPCESNTLALEFENPIACDSIYAAAFQLFGPQFPTVTDATPLNCLNNTATLVALTFSPPINFSGTYQVTYTSVLDLCIQNYVLQATETFAVVDCPLNVILSAAEEPGCSGDTITVIATASGGDASSYTYEWSPIENVSDTLTTVLYDSTTFYVTVTDATGSSVVGSILLSPLDNPVIDLPADTTLCQSVLPFYLTATPTGGNWYAQGIQEAEQMTGLYEPGLVTTPLDTIFYVLENGCESSTILEITPLYQGTADASCPGAAPFLVSGGLPLGGTWSGELITPQGLFTPTDTAASFLVTYTHPNGCSGDKWVNIDTLTMPSIDSLCQSAGTITLPVTPYGGVWSGNGIVNADLGRFDPYESGQGDHQLLYEINGCTDTIEIHVREIFAAANFSACPTQAAFNLPGDWYPQNNSSWSGNGIINDSGIFDPSLVNNVPDTLWFETNGCTDFRLVRVIPTEILFADTLFFCPTDAPIDLPTDNQNVIPQLGSWSGTGVTDDSEGNYSFQPSIAGSGTHVLYYHRNTCLDSLLALVYPTPVITPAAFCEIDGADFLEVDDEGGVWSGDGIINPQTGVFDPSIVGAGNWEVSYTATSHCVGSQTIAVAGFEEAMLSGVNDFYCFKDTVIVPLTSPSGGLLELDEVATNSINPATIGSGVHTLTYEIGEAACADTETLIFSVGTPVEVSATTDSILICYGQQTTIGANASGGSSLGNYTYSWNQGLGFGQSQYIQPSDDAQYIVVAADGCSDTAQDTVWVEVGAPILFAIETGVAVCYEDTTFAFISPLTNEEYNYNWNISPPNTTAFLENNPGTYSLTITDVDSGCAIDTAVLLPGYSPLTANFSISPTVPCLSTLSPDIQLLDLSVGGTTGLWSFGDSSQVVSYQPNTDWQHTFTASGTYDVRLYIENEGGCSDEHVETVCVEDAHTLFAPNAMTPNGDGKNDFFQFVGVNVQQIEWNIYDRYGQILFTANNLADQWNGKYKNQRVQSGVYVWTATYQPVGTNETHAASGYITVIY